LKQLTYRYTAPHCWMVEESWHQLFDQVSGEKAGTAGLRRRHGRRHRHGRRRRHGHRHKQQTWTRM